MKNKYRKIIGITLILLGCSAVGIRVGGKILFDRESKKEVYQFLENDISENTIKENIIKENDLVESTTTKDNLSESIKKDISASEAYKDIKQGDKIGVIEIPSLGIQHIIVEGTEKENIKKNVGHFVETSMPGEYGNFCIAGHRNNLYNEVFKGLADVDIGAEVIIKALHGEFVYEIYKKEVIEPEEIEVLNQELLEKEMTIITCTKDGKQRVCVKARLIFNL